MNQNEIETWTSNVFQRGDVAAIKQRVLEDPTYLTSTDFRDDTPLKYAIDANHLDLVEFLLAHGADPNEEKSSDGFTCLLCALADGKDERLPVFSKLIAAGADIHRRGTNGWAPLHMAAANGQVKAIRLLLQAGARVNQPAEVDGETALWLAAFNGQAEVVEVLLAHGADPSMKDCVIGDTPLQAARSAEKRKTQRGNEGDYGGVIRILTEHMSTVPKPSRSIWRRIFRFGRR